MSYLCKSSRLYAWVVQATRLSVTRRLSTSAQLLVFMTTWVTTKLRCATVRVSVAISRTTMTSVRRWYPIIWWNTQWSLRVPTWRAMNSEPITACWRSRECLVFIHERIAGNILQQSVALFVYVKKWSDFVAFMNVDIGIYAEHCVDQLTQMHCLKANVGR